MIGPLTDTLVLRTLIPFDDEPLKVLRLVRQNFITACQLRDIPFEAMASRLVAETAIKRADLAQVFFLFDEADPAMPQINGMTAEPEVIGASRDFFKSALHDYDMVLYLAKSGDGMKGQLTLKGEIDDGTVATGLLRSYRSLLEELVELRD
jgi:hypothetical protein